MFKAKLNQYNETLPLTNNSAERALHAKNDNFRFEDLGYYQLIDHGTYYYPAWKHYNRKTNVFCDRCQRQNLRACIGYSHFDLCLLCVDELTRLNFDCPSRHCHESKFINDNSVSFMEPSYVDLNRKYFNQQYTMKSENFENVKSNDQDEEKLEHFSDTEKSCSMFSEISNTINLKNVSIIIIIALVLYYAISFVKSQID
jgi:hypothetical protein